MNQNISLFIVTYTNKHTGVMFFDRAEAATHTANHCHVDSLKNPKSKIHRFWALIQAEKDQRWEI